MIFLFQFLSLLSVIVCWGSQSMFSSSLMCLGSSINNDHAMGMKIYEKKLSSFFFCLFYLFAFLFSSFTTGSTWQPPLSIMPEHNTRQTTTDHLEEAVNRLTQGQTTVAQNHAALSQAQSVVNIKIDSILECLVAITTTPTSLKSPPTPSPPPPS